MKLCIAEKPSVAGEIAKIIGANQRKQGYFEGNGYAVTWTFGHLCTLKEPGDYAPEYQKWNINSLPILPEVFDVKLIDNKGVNNQFEVIKTLVSQASEVINCGDAGQEGELIQRWVLNHAGMKVPMKRLWISSLTEEAIKEGFKKLLPSSDFDSLFDAGQCRAIGDWLYGINATRLYTLKYGKQKQVLSLGRVQTPTLALIVKRHFEIKNFVPGIYFELKTKYRDTFFAYEKGKFDKKQDGEKIVQIIQNKELVISEIIVKKANEYPPNLFDLTSLQVEANNKFGWSADSTLKTTQSLYEKKLITYPRVDTVFLPNDQYPKIKGIMGGLSAYQTLVKPLLEKAISKSKKIFNDSKVTDHHAIIPTGVNANQIGGDEMELYNIIALRFIAAFYPECEVSNTTVNAVVEKIPFKANGRQVLKPGWRVVYAQEKQVIDGEENKNTLPIFVKGESGAHEPVFEQKQNSPPKEYTEATLLRAMETAGKNVENEELQQLMKENGIGRPSTRANIIETLFKRQYIEKSKKKLLPTDTGINLIQLIDNPTLKSAELTGRWEKRLREIEDNKYSSAEFLSEMKKMISVLVDEVQSHNPSQQKIRCPKCEVGSIVKGKSAFGCSDWKNGCEFVIPFQIESSQIENGQIKTVQIPDNQVVNLIQNKSIQIGTNTVIMDNWFKIKLNEPNPTSGICPKCEKGEVKKGKTAYGCSLYGKGCDYLVAF